MNDFLKHAEELFPYTQAMRRDFHRHPELGFREIRTGGIVAKELEALGLEVTKGVGKTGVVGYLEGSRPGPTMSSRRRLNSTARFAPLNPKSAISCIRASNRSCAASPLP